MRSRVDDPTFLRPVVSSAGCLLKQAVVWTAVVHQGADGHMAPALPAIVAPYGVSATVVYGWYPRPCDARDAFRMGNYGVRETPGGKVSLQILSPLLHAKRNG